MTADSQHEPQRGQHGPTSPSEPVPATPKVVLLHGLGANHQAFQRFVRILPDGWEMHPLDLLGHGDAAKPESGYSLEDYAAYLHDQLEGAGLLTPEPPVVLGHSLGAAVSVAYAARYPDEYHSLVLLDPPKGQGQQTQAMLDAKIQGNVAETVNRLFADQSGPLREWTINTWNTMAEGVARELEPDWERYAGTLQRPVTIVHGDAELGASGAAAWKHFNDAATKRIAGAGHYLHATHARETAKAVEDAVEDHTTGESGT